MIWFLAGCLVGIAITIFAYSRKRVGTLRIDYSDPSDGPYFFLEVDAGKADKIAKHKRILLKVNKENYISQE